MPAVGDLNSEPPSPPPGADPDTAAADLQTQLDLAFRIQFANRGGFPEAFLSDICPLVDEGAAKQALERLAPVIRRCHISRVHHAFLTLCKERRGWSP